MKSRYSINEPRIAIRRPLVSSVACALSRLIFCPVKARAQICGAFSGAAPFLFAVNVEVHRLNSERT